MPAVRPTVSVIIPTHNRLDYLREAIESVFAQTYDAWELVVVDEGSTDGSQEYLAGLGDSGVHLITSQRCGNPARLRNAGIAKSQGEFIAFLDSDDLWMPEKLDVQLSELRAHPECDWSYTRVTLIDANGTEIEYTASRAKPFRPYSGFVIEQLLVHEASIVCPTVIATRRVISEVGGFDESLLFCEDYDLFLRLAIRSKVWAISTPLTKVRHHAGNNTRGNPNVDASFVRVYTKFVGEHPDAHVRRLCNRQRGLYSVRLAEQLLRQGARARGYRELLAALRFRPLFGRLWIVLLKSLLFSLGRGRTRQDR